MRKIITITSALMVAGFGMPVFAADMAPGRVAEGPQNGTYQVVVMGNGITLQWPGSELHFTTAAPTFEVSYNDGTPEVATTCQIGTEYDEEETSYVYFNIFDFLGAEFDWDTFTYTYNYGKYKVSIPAGIIADADGDLNPQQTIEFTLCKKLAADTGDGLNLVPAESLSYWDENGNEVPAPVYESSQLSNITLSWDDVNVELTDVEGVNAVAYVSVEDQGGVPNYVNINSYISIKNGKLCVDLSNSSIFTDDRWIVEIPAGYVKATVGKDIYTNANISLTYIIQNGEVAGDMEMATVIEGPDMFTSPFVTYILTWDYAEITATDLLGAVLLADDGMTQVEVPASAFMLMYVPQDDEDNHNPGVQADSYNALRIELAETIAQINAFSPMFTLRIPAGIVENTLGQKNPEQSFTFQVVDVYTAQPDCVETGDPGVYQLIWPAEYIFFTGSGGMFVVKDSTGERYDLEQGNGFSSEGITAGQYGVTMNDKYEDIILVNLHNMGLTPGSYTLIIEEGTVIFEDSSWAMYINGEAYISLELNEVATSIESVLDGNDGLISVYNLQGVKVLETRDASAIRELNKGIYIINGKKVAVK